MAELHRDNNNEIICLKEERDEKVLASSGKEFHIVLRLHAEILYDCAL